MPTSKKSDYYNRPKPSVQELKLNINSSTSSRQESLKKYAASPKPIKRSMNTKYEVCESIQNLSKVEPTEAVADKCYDGIKPLITVPTIELRLSEPESSSSTPQPKQRGYDLTSSTNSHFKGLIIAGPKKFKRTCSSASTSSKPKISSSSLQTTTAPAKVSDEKQVTSQEMIDSQHKESGAKRKIFRGPEWKKPCQESVVAGAPKPFVGTCPLNFQEFAKLSRVRQKFFLTQDPRKKYCLVNPQALRTNAFSEKREFKILTNSVKYGDNLCGETQSHSSESFVCEEIDLENPMQLDFQGLDYKNTYQADEQDTQNQSLYRSIVRYMERRGVKQEIEKSVEAELLHERLAVPECFAVQDRTIQEKEPSSEPPVPFCKLFRAADKPYNQEKIAEERRNRHDRYKTLYLRRKKLAEQKESARKQQDKVDEELKPTMLANKNFTEVVNSINAACHPDIKIEGLLREPEKPKQCFPHTMRETKQFKKNLKTENRIKRDNALVKKEYVLQNLGKLKDYPEAKLDISSDTPKHSVESPELSEQSSDDEDAIDVGKHGSNYKLRGFHFKLGESLRGKQHQTEKTGGARKEKTCKTREQWLAELVPKKEAIMLDIEEGIPKLRSPDDPLLKICMPKFEYKLPQIKSSAVREYIEKRLGRHYERDLRKKFRMVRPRLEYPLKKFNLIRFLFDDNIQDLSNVKLHKAEKYDETDLMKMNTTLEYMAAKENIKKKMKAQMKQKRLKLLGIPCYEVKRSSLQTKCEQSDTDTDPEWVPEPEPELVDQKEENERAKFAKSVGLPMPMRGNMPAPKYRETTLRRHPRKPRDYLKERVPSVLFDHTVAEVHKPHLLKLSPDEIYFNNLREVKKSKYSKLFETRHHHDHGNYMQQKPVDVHYQPKLVKAKVTKAKRKEDQVVMEKFRMAQPPCNEFVEMDLSLPKADTKALLEKLQNSRKQVTADKGLGSKDLCQQRDFYYHSRPHENLETLDYPGHKEYLDFLHEVRKALYESKVNEDEGQKIAVDRDEIIQEIEEDLKSIETCLTSLSSSVCTNLTNDSGSFLLMEGKTKIPLDYIRKSVVPFEAINRCRFKLEPLDMETEENNPFKVMPFAGQHKAQLELSTAKDSFFTFNTRLQNGMRLRLEVPVEDVRQKLIGRARFKYRSVVTTDIDENYVDELKNRPPVKMFSFKSGMSFIKDALRLKFESMLIQGQIVRTKIYDRLNEHHWERMLRLKTLYEKLFTKWEKREYEAAMSVVHKVKSYYDRTDALRREFRELERQQIILNMDIVFVEGHWIRRIMLQNFHYLLGDSEWRYENDWIHRIEQATQPSTECDEEEEGEEEEEAGERRCEKVSIELENFEESIAKRSIVNIRKRDKDNAWAIKAFYENVYLQNLHPILIVFPNAESFMLGIDNLKTKTFVLLLEMHFTLSIHSELQSRLETFQEWCLEDLREKQAYVSRKCAKLYFMSDRAADMKKRSLEFLVQPIEESFNDETFIKHRAIIAEVWRGVVPGNMRSASGEDLESLEMVAMISEVVLELISTLDYIPVDESRRIEAQLRRRYAYDRKISRQAYQVEKRIESEMKKVRHNLEPPYVKPKREGKLTRIFIKKKQKKDVLKEQRVSEHTKFFFRAFHDEGDVMQLQDARDSIFVMDTIQEQIVPFYFDHFLKLNGYTPNYNFKTNIELRDGSEVSRVAFPSLLPEVLERLDKWEAARKRTMEDNIQRNPKMYVDVQF